MSATARALGVQDRRFDGSAELQTGTDADRAARAIRRICPVAGLSVAGREAEEPSLRPLPASLPGPFDTVKTAPVHRDCIVHSESRGDAVPFLCVGREVEVRGCSGSVQILDPRTAVVPISDPRHTRERISIEPACDGGPGTARVLPPGPPGRMARKLPEIAALPVGRRPVDLYAAPAEVAR